MSWEIYSNTINTLLRDIPLLERKMLDAVSPEESQKLHKSLRYREQKLDRLLSYQERWQLRQMCLESGVSGNFL